MEEILFYTKLYDLYKKTLTEKQRKTFQDYFFENLTLEEIAENNGVSKNAVAKTIRQIKDILVAMEDKVHMNKYIEAVKEEFKDDEGILKRIEKYDSIIE